MYVKCQCRVLDTWMIIESIIKSELHSLCQVQLMPACFKLQTHHRFLPRFDFLLLKKKKRKKKEKEKSLKAYRCNAPDNYLPWINRDSVNIRSRLWNLKRKITHIRWCILRMLYLHQWILIFKHMGKKTHITGCNHHRLHWTSRLYGELNRQNLLLSNLNEGIRQLMLWIKAEYKMSLAQP